MLWREVGRVVTRTGGRLPMLGYATTDPCEDGIVLRYPKVCLAVCVRGNWTRTTALCSFQGCVKTLMSFGLSQPLLRL